MPSRPSLHRRALCLAAALSCLAGLGPALGAPTISRSEARPPRAVPAPAPSAAPLAPCPASELESLRAAREEAVLRGMQWIDRYLRRPGSRSSLGIDAASLFVEIALTAASPRVAEPALALARREAKRLAKRYLRRGGIDSRDDFLGAIYLLPDSAILELPEAELLGRCIARFARFPSANELYDYDLRKLDRIPEPDLFSLLVDAYTVDRANLTYPFLFRPSFGLREVLAFIAKKPLVPYDKDRTRRHKVFHHHAYLATHVGFVLDDYSRLPLEEAHFRVAYAFLRDQALKVYEKRDLELIAEIADLWRSMGRTEGNDGFVCAATRLLLASQHRDGSFGAWWKESDGYGAIHYTWTAVDALRERFFLQGTAFERYREALMRSGAE
jgi:hypothetical protein